MSLYSKLAWPIVFIVLLTSCQKPNVTSWVDHYEKYDDRGLCFTLAYGMSYGDLLHNAPRQHVWRRAAARVRFGGAGGRHEVTRLASCASSPDHYVLEPTLNSTRIRQADRLWTFDGGIYGNRHVVQSPDGRRVSFQFKGEEANGFVHPGIAEESGAFYVIRWGWEEAGYILFYPAAGRAEHLVVDFASVFSARVGDPYYLDATPVDVEVLDPPAKAGAN